MKKILLYTFLIVIGLVALVQSGILNALMIFVLIGVIPGTSYVVSPGFMLLAMITIIWVVIFRLAARETLYSIATKDQTEPKKRMPRRRYNQI